MDPCVADTVAELLRAPGRGEASEESGMEAYESLLASARAGLASAQRQTQGAAASTSASAARAEANRHLERIERALEVLCGSNPRLPQIEEKDAYREILHAVELVRRADLQRTYDAAVSGVYKRFATIEAALALPAVDTVPSSGGDVGGCDAYPDALQALEELYEVLLNVKVLPEHLRQTVVTGCEGARAALRRALERALCDQLDALEWPSIRRAPTEDEGRTMQAIFGALLRLEPLRDADRAKDTGEDSLWAVHAVAKGTVARFAFHFLRRKASTAAAGHPEWCTAAAVKDVRACVPFVAALFQPVADTRPYARMYDIAAEFIAVYAGVLRRKYSADLAVLRTCTSSAVVRYARQGLAFDRAVTALLGRIPTLQESGLSALVAPNLLEMWKAAESARLHALVRRACQATDAWEDSEGEPQRSHDEDSRAFVSSTIPIDADDDAVADIARPIRASDVIVASIEACCDRIAAVPSECARHTLVDGAVAQAARHAVDLFREALDSAEERMASDESAWKTVCGIANAANFVSLALEELGERTEFAGYEEERTLAKGSSRDMPGVPTGPALSARTLLLGLSPSFGEIVMRACRVLAEHSGAEFGGSAGVRAYATHCRAALRSTGDLSGELCAPLGALHARMHHIRSSLPKRLQSLVWPVCCRVVDSSLFDVAIRGGRFTGAGVSQLKVDVEAVQSVYCMFTSSPEAHMRRTSSAVRVMGLHLEQRRALEIVLTSALENHAAAAADEIRAMRAAAVEKLRECGVGRASVDDALAALRARVADG